MENNVKEFDQNTGEVSRLPLWKALLDEIGPGLHYGQVFDTTYFEQKLKCNRDSIHFGISVSHIRRALEQRGMYITGRGQKGAQFVIIPAQANVNIMRMYSAEASDKMRRALKLGSTTPIEMLNEQQKRNHENMLEKIAWKVAMLARRQPPKISQNKTKMISAG